LNRDLIFIAAALFSWGVGESMFYEFRPLYLQQLGADPLLIGAILGTVGTAMAVSHLPAGYLADRIGRRPLIRTAWVMGVLASWIMAFSNTLPVFAFGIILYGVTYFVNGPLSSYVTAARGNLGVGRALTLTSAFFSLGGIFGPLAGGWIGEHYGMRVALISASVTFVISTMLIFCIRAQPVEKLSPEKHPTQNLLNRRFLQFLLVVFFVAFVLYLPQPLSPNFLQNQRQVNLIQMGQMIALSGLGVVVLTLVLGHLNGRLGLLLAQVAMAAFALFIWQGNGMGWYLAAYFFMGSYRTARSLAIAQGKSLLHDAHMGLGYGMIEVAIAASIVVAPPLAGWLYAQNPHWIYSISLSLIGVALLLTFFIMPTSAEKSELTLAEKETTIGTVELG